LGIVVFVAGQSMFFLLKAWKQGKKLGITSGTMRNTITQSAIFTIAPAISIVATVITLAYSLGIVLPWLRMLVIGNITYEATAAEAALNAMGGNLSQPVEDKSVFAAAAWVMTIGSAFPLILVPILLKKIQKKIGQAVQMNQKWADVMSAAAFIGLISAFISRAVAGAGDEAVIGDGAGVLSLSALLVSIGLMLILQTVCNKFKVKWLEPFAMPLSMLGAMGAAMLLAQILPESIAFLEWRG